MKTGVSVIICCYNSEKTIKQVLNSLLIQENSSDFAWEVIVVDNASADKTADTARETWTRNDIDFKVVFEGEPGLSNARRKGLETSRYSVVVFVDDDNILQSDYISRAYALMNANPEVGLAGGLGTAVTSGDLPDWFGEYESAYAIGAQAADAGYLPLSRTYLHGAGIVMRKQAWNKLMDSNFTFLLSGRKGKSLSSGEDSEMTSAFRLAGYELWYDPGLRFEHIIPQQRLKWDYVVKLAKEFGKAAVVLDLYKTQIRGVSGWKKRKVNSWMLSTAISFYNLLRILPGYVAIFLKHREGRKREFEFSYYRGYFIQKLSLVTRYSMVKKEISRLKQDLKY